MDEKFLISGLKNGDEIAYSELVHSFQERIYNTVLGLVHHAEDAEDITQEVFITVFQSISRFREESRLATWIYRIAVTRSLDFLRSQQRKKRFGFLISLTGEENRLQKEPFHFHHPGVQLENKEKASILWKAIEKLPEQQKIAFVLHKTEQLSYTEIAAVMEVTVPAVESLLVRAKKNLQKFLGVWYELNKK